MNVQLTLSNENTTCSESQNSAATKMSRTQFLQMKRQVAASFRKFDRVQKKREGVPLVVPDSNKNVSLNSKSTLVSVRKSLLAFTAASPFPTLPIPFPSAAPSAEEQKSSENT